MDNPIPPLLPEQQIYLAQEKLKRSRRRHRWLWFFFAVSLAANLIFYLVLYFQHEVAPEENGSVFAERYLSGERDSENKIAVIRVEGIITSEMEAHVGHDGMVGDIKEQLRLAATDENVKAIILRIDSPGGEILASDEIYRAIRDARDNYKKPIICSMGSLAASGGYYAALGASWIIADELTITGSIGVILHTFNYKDLLGKIGVKSVVFKSGQFKDILNGSRDPLPGEDALIQGLVMESYEQFLNIVAKERNLDMDQLRNGLADGRIFSGKQAFATKLVDQTGSFDDAIKKAKKDAKIQEAQIFDYIEPFSLKNLLGIFAKNSTPKIQLEWAPQSLHLQQGKLYYLSPHLF